MSNAALMALTSAADAYEPVYGMTSGRLGPTIAAVAALVAAAVGALAVARSRGGKGRRGAIVAFVLGLATAGSGVVFLATAGGGPGTGNGVIGSGAAIVVGLTACLLGGLVLARPRREDA